MSKYTDLVSDRLVESIEEYIDTHSLHAGDALPSERRLCELFGANRLSLRRALRDLSNEGRLSIEHGRGNFLRADKYVDDTVVFTSFSRGWQEDGYSTGARVLRFGCTESNIKIARRLELPLGTQVYELRRLRSVDGIAMYIETAFLPYSLLPGLEKHDFSVQSLYGVLRREYGIELVRQQENVGITQLTGEECALMSAPAGTSAFFIRSTAYNEDGQAVEYCQSVARADCCKIRL